MRKPWECRGDWKGLQRVSTPTVLLDGGCLILWLIERVGCVLWPDMLGAACRCHPSMQGTTTERKENESFWTHKWCKTLVNLLKPIGYVMHQKVEYFSNCTLCPYCMCYVFIWGQTATCVIYIKTRLVFITEMKSVYSAVRTGSLNEAVCTPSFKGETVKQSHYKSGHFPRVPGG
jgi:hypothetical protein